MTADTGMQKKEKIIERLLTLVVSAVQLILHRRRTVGQINELLDALQRFKDGGVISNDAKTAPRARPMCAKSLTDNQLGWSHFFVGRLLALSHCRHTLHQAEIYTLGELMQWNAGNLRQSLKLDEQSVHTIARILRTFSLRLGMDITIPDREQIHKDRITYQQKFMGQTRHKLHAFNDREQRTLHDMGLHTVGHFVRYVNNERENVVSFCTSIGCNNPTLAAEIIIEYLSEFGFLEGAAYIPDGVTLPAADE